MSLPKHQQEDHLGLEILASQFTGKHNAPTLTAIANLTDQSTGTATDFVVAIPAAVASVGADTSAATVVSVNASLAAIRNEVASLAAKVNAILTALK
jgi:hypothetical protein